MTTSEHPHGPNCCEVRAPGGQPLDPERDLQDSSCMCEPKSPPVVTEDRQQTYIRRYPSSPSNIEVSWTENR